MEEQSSFREYVTAWLASTRRSAASLSEDAGIDQSLLSKYLHARPDKRVRPSPRNLHKLAPVLGVPYEDLMRMCGYLPGEPRAEVDARRQAVRDQLDRWLLAVGPEYEDAFWRQLKSQGDSTVDLIRQIGTAVNAEGETAVNAAVSERAKRGRRPRDNGNGSLRATEHALASHRAHVTSHVPSRRAA